MIIVTAPRSRLLNPLQEGSEYNKTRPIGFEFEFYGENGVTKHTQFSINENGYIFLLTDEVSANRVQNDISTTIDPTSASAQNGLLESIDETPLGGKYVPIIIPFWDAFAVPKKEKVAGGFNTPLYLAYRHDSPQGRRLILQWNELELADGGGEVTFQLVLHENTNEIEFRYKDVTGDKFVGGAGATIGLVDSLGSFNQFSYNAPKLSNDSRVVFRPNGLVLELSNQEYSDDLIQPITVRGDELIAGDGSSGLAELQVQTLSDGLGEGDEEIDLRLVARGLPVNFDPPILTPRVIDDAPRISLEPITTSVAEGETVTFRITASEPLDEIQEIRPGYSINDIYDPAAVVNISGEGKLLKFYDQNLDATPDVNAPTSELRKIGFGFEFQGESYSELVVSSNGYVTFDPTGAGSASTELPVSSLDPANGGFDDSEAGLTIAPLWLSLVPDLASVYDRMIGEVGDRQYIVQWDLMVSHSTGPQLATFQLVLYERDNTIEFRYGDISLPFAPDGVGDAYKLLIGLGYGEGRGLDYTEGPLESVLYLVPNRKLTLTPSYFELRTDSGADFTALQYRDSAGEWVPGNHLIDLATLFADTTTLEVQLGTKRDLLLEGTEQPIIELVVNEGSELSFVTSTLELEISDKPINVGLTVPTSVREGENFNLELSLSEPLPANTAADYLSYQYTIPENVTFEDISDNDAKVKVMFDPADAQVGRVQYIDLDFDFQFYGNTHDTVFASASGFLAFTGGRTWTASRRDDRRLTTQYQDLSRGIDGTPLSDIAPNEAPTGYPTIAPFWSHLDATTAGGGGSVYYLAKGEAPNRELIVQWDHVRVDKNVSDTNVTFQAILRESGGIEFRYMDLNGKQIVGTIGVTDGTDNEGTNNGLFTQVGFETPFPTAVQAYRFEPPLLEITIEPEMIEPEMSGKFNPIFPIRINPNDFGVETALTRTITVEDAGALESADYTLNLGLSEGYSQTLALGQARVGLVPVAKPVELRSLRVLAASQVSVDVDLTAATDGVYESNTIMLDFELSDTFATDRDILRVSVDSPDDFDGFTSTIINSALFDQSRRATLTLLIPEDNEFEGTESHQITIDVLSDSEVALKDPTDKQLKFDVFDNIALVTLSVSPRTIFEGGQFEATVELNTRPRPGFALVLKRQAGEQLLETKSIGQMDFDSNSLYQAIFETTNTVLFNEDVTHRFTLATVNTATALVVGSAGQPAEQVTVDAIVTDGGGLPQLSLTIEPNEIVEGNPVTFIIKSSKLLAQDHLSGTIQILTDDAYYADFASSRSLVRTQLSIDSTAFIETDTVKITLTISNDGEVEGAETIQFRLDTDPQAEVVANPDRRTADLRVIDEDATRASLELSAPAILEGETVTLSIQLSEPLLDRDMECGPTFNHAGCTTNSYDNNSGLISGDQFENIAKPENELTLNAGKRATVELDFAFELYEVTHYTVTIAQNGFVSFGPNQFGSTEQVINNGDLTSASELPGGHAQATIAPLWGQEPDAGTVYATYLGEPGDPNRRYVIQWNEIRFSTRSDLFTFQLVLYENASDFEFRYDKATPMGDRDRFNHTIGVADGNGEFTRLAYVRTAVSANEGVEIKDDIRVRFSKALLSIDIERADGIGEVDGTEDFNRQFPIFLAPLLLGQKTAAVDLGAKIDSDREVEEIYQFKLNFAPDAGFATGLNSERELIVWDQGLTAADIELIPATLTEGQTVAVRVTLSRDALSEPIVPTDLQLRVSSPGILTETFPVNLLDRFDGSDSIDLVYEIPHNLIPNSAQPLDFALSVPENGPVVIGNGGATATLTISDYTVEAQLELLTPEVNEGDTAQVRVTLDQPLRAETGNALQLVTDSPDQLHGSYPIDLSALLGSELTEIVLDIIVAHDTILESNQTINLRLVADEQFAITLTPRASNGVNLDVVDRTRLTANLIIADTSVPETEPIEVRVELSGPLGQGSNLVLDTAELVDREAFEEQFPIDLGAISSSSTEFTFTLRPIRDYLSNQDTITLNLDSSVVGSSIISFVNRAVDVTIEDAVVGVDLRFLETEIAEGDVATLRITLTEPLNIPNELPRDYVSRISNLNAGEFEDLVAEGINSEPVTNNRQVFDNVDIGFDFRVYDETTTVIQIGAPGYIAFTDVDDLDNRDNQGAPVDLAQGSASTPQGNGVPTFAPYWTDNIMSEQFDFSRNNLYTATVGITPGERRFIVQWNEIQIGGSTDEATFQIVLFEESGEIEFRYKDVPDTVNAIVGITNGNDLNNNGRFTEIDPNDLTDNTRIRFTPQNEFLLRVVSLADGLNAADADDYTVEFPLELPELRGGITEFDVTIPFPSETATVVTELPEQLTLELSVPPLLTVERGLTATVLVVDTTPVEAGIRQPELTGMTHTITVREGTGLTLTIEINTSLGFDDLQVDYEVLPYDGIGKQAEVEDLVGQQVIKDTAVIQKGETTTEIRIDTLDDNIAEYYEYLLVRLTDARAVDVREQARVVTEQSEVILRIRDNEPVEYRFRGATQTIESDGIYELTLERRGAVPLRAVSHTYTVVGSEGPGRQPAEARDFKNGILRQEILLEGLFEFDQSELFENEDSITIGLEDDKAPEEPKQFTVRAAGQQKHVLLDDNDALVDARFPDDLQAPTLAEGRTIAVPFELFNLFLRNRNQPGESDEIEVGFRIVPESAENSDYELPLTTVSVPADETAGVVEVVIPDDNLYEGEETFRLEITEVQLLSDNKRLYNEAERLERGIPVTIEVDPADLPQFEAQPMDGGIQNEGITYTLQIELVNADADGSPTDLTLEFQSAGTASTTTDYQIQPLTIDATQSTATVEIRLIDDTLYEPTETVELSIVTYSVDGGPSQVHTPTVTHQFEIADQDSPVIRLRTENGSNIVNEMDGQVTLLIVLGNAPTTGSPEDLDIVIDIAQSSVASMTLDYNLLQTTAQIGRGESQAEIVLELVDDGIYEATENLDLYPANIVINGRNYPATATAANTSVITIEDDDKIVASLDRAASDTSFAESDTATVRVVLNQPFPAGTPAVFRFATSTVASTDLLITQNGSVSSLTDTLTIVFAEGQTEAVLLIEVAESEKDNRLEPHETIGFILTAENDPRAEVDSARAEIDIDLLDDDDLVLGLVSLSDNEREVAEGQSVTLELRTLNGIISDEAISVDYQVVFPKIDGVVDDQLANKDDVTTLTGTVVLPARQVTIAFPPSSAIMIVDDDLPELYETFRVELLNVQSATQYASRARVVDSGESPDTLPAEQIWIRDDEPNEFSVRITDMNGNPVMEVEDNGDTIPGVPENEPFRVEALFRGEPRGSIEFSFTVRSVVGVNSVNSEDFEGGQAQTDILVVGDTIGGGFDSIAAVTITPANDDTSERDEFNRDERFDIEVEIAPNPAAYTLDPELINAVLIDDDIALNAEFDESGVARYDENDRKQTELIILSDRNSVATDLTVTVSFIAIHGTASAEDFAISSTVVIPPSAGQRSADLGIEIENDLIIEGAEDAMIFITRLDLSDGSSLVYLPENRPQLRIRINDDDDENGTQFRIEGIPTTVEEGEAYTFTIYHTRIDTDEEIIFSERVGVNLLFTRNGIPLSASEAQRFVIRDSSGVRVADLPDRIGSAANPLTFTLLVDNNERVEGDLEGYRLVLTIASPGEELEEDSTRIFNVNDDDRVKVIFGQPEYTVVEGETVAIGLSLDNTDRGDTITVELFYHLTDNSEIDSAEPDDYKLDVADNLIAFGPSDTVKTVILDVSSPAGADEIFEFTEKLILRAVAADSDQPVERSDRLTVLITDLTEPTIEVKTYIGLVRTPDADDTSEARAELREADDIRLTVRPTITNLDPSFSDPALVELGPLDKGIPRLPVEVTVDLSSDEVTYTGTDPDYDIIGLDSARTITIGGPDHSATTQFDIRIVNDILIGEGDEQFQIDIRRYEFDGQPAVTKAPGRLTQYLTIIDNIITPELTLTPLTVREDEPSASVEFAINNVKPVEAATVTLDVSNGRYTLSGTEFTIAPDNTTGTLTLMPVYEPGYTIPQNVTFAVRSIQFAGQSTPAISLVGEPTLAFIIEDVDHVVIETATVLPNLIMEVGDVEGAEGLSLAIRTTQLIPAGVASGTVVLDTVDPAQRADFNQQLPFDLTSLLMMTDTLNYGLTARVDTIFEGLEQVELQIIVNEDIIEIPQRLTQFTVTIADSIDAIKLGLVSKSIERVEGQTVTLDVELTAAGISYPQDVEIEYVIDFAPNADDEYLATLADLATAGTTRITDPAQTHTVILPAGMARTTIEITTVDDTQAERYEQFDVRLIGARNVQTNEIVPIIGDSDPQFAPRVAVFLEDNEPTGYRLVLDRTSFTEGERLTFAIEQVGTPRQRIEYQVVGYGDNPVLAADISGTISDALLADGFVLFTGVVRDAVVGITALENDVGERNKQLQIQVVEDTATVGPLLATAIATLQDNDPGVVFAVTDELVVGERDGTVQIDLSLIGVASSTLYLGREVIVSANLISGVADRVQFSGTDLTGVNPADIAVIRTAATFGVNGIAPVKLDLFDNALYENDAVFELIIESLQIDDSGTVIIYSAGEEPRRSVRVVSDDLPLQFQVPTETFSETHTVAPLRITVTGTRETVGQTITVALLAVDDTTEPEDYNLPATAELIAGGDRVINLEIVNDDLYEISEKLTVYVISATLNGITTVFAEANRPSVEVEITDEDDGSDQPRVRFVPDSVSVPEGTDLTTEDLRLELINADPDGSPDVFFVIVDIDRDRSTAEETKDYKFPNQRTNTFGKGAKDIRFNANIVDDRIDDEPDETIFIVARFNEADPQPAAELVITIRDVIPFELRFDQTRLTEDGTTVTGTLDFSASTIGATRSTETVSFVIDTATLRLGDYRVVTSDLVTAAVLSNGATAFTVTVPAGSATAEFTIEAVDDQLYEEDELLVLSGRGFSDGIIFVNRGLSLTGTVAFRSTEFEFTIIDNEVAEVTLPQSLVQVSEAMTASVPIAVNFATFETLTVNLRVTDDTAARGIDYEPFATTIEIPRGATGTVLTIVPIDNNDPTQASSRKFAVQLESASYPSSPALVEVNTRALTTIEILEDDTFNVVTLTIPDLDLIGRPEPGQGDDARATVNIQLVLSEPLTEPVRVDVAVDYIGDTDATDFVLSGGDLVPDSDDTTTAGSLTFAPGETEVVTILQIRDDNITEFAQESYRLVFDVTEKPADVVIDVVGMQIQTGTILPERITPTVSITLPSSMGEPDVDRFTTRIGIEWTNPAQDARYTFGVRATDIEATSGEDYEPLDQNLRLLQRTGATGEVELVILDDNINELDERLLIEVYEPSDPDVVYATSTVTILETFDPAELSFGATTAIVREGKTVDLPIAINNIGFAGLAEDVSLTVELSYNGIPEEKVVAQTSITVPQGTVTGTYSFSIARDGLLGESGTVTVQIKGASGVRTGEAHLIADPLTTTVTVIKPPTASLVEVPPLNEGQQQEITVTTSEALDYDVTIELAVDSTSTAIVGRDYAALPPSVTVPAGATSVTFALEALNDDLYEQDDETVVLGLLLDGHPDLNRGMATTVTAVIRSTNPTPTVSIEGVQPVDEGTTREFQIVLDGKLDVALRIDISIVTSTAELGVDYELPLTSFEIPAEELTATAPITLNALQDTVKPPEMDEFVVLALSVPADSPVMTAAATRITIRNNDLAPPVVSLAEVESVIEGNSAVIGIGLDRPSNVETIVNLEVKIESSTAVLDTDYRNLRGEYLTLTSTITIPDGVTETTVILDTIDDLIYEMKEQVTLVLSVVGDAVTLGAESERVIIIVDNEDRPTLSLDEILPIMEGGEVQITATLDVALDVPLTLNLVTAAISSAGAVTDYEFSATSLVIAAGDLITAVTLRVRDDDLYEGNEILTLGLRTASDMPILGTITRTVTIVESEQPPVISFDPNVPAETIDEGEMVTVRVILTGVPSVVDETITVQVGGTATEGADFEPITATVTIAAGETVSLITIKTTTPPDLFYEGDETILLDLVSSSGFALIGEPRQREITIRETLPAPTVSLLQPPATVNEGGQIEIEATIPEPVAVDIVVTISSTIGLDTAILGDDYTFDSETAIIVSGQETATFRLNASSDTLFEQTETVVLKLDSATAGVGVDQTEYTLSIVNTTPPPISFAPVARVVEGESATVTIRIASPIGFDVEVTLAVAPSSTATLVDDYAQIPTTVTIPANAQRITISVDTIDDLNDEPLRELLILQVTEVAGFQLTEDQRPSVTIEIEDNDIPTNVIVPALTGVEGETITAEFALDYAQGRDVNLRLEVRFPANGPDVNPDVTSFTIAAGVTSAIVEIYLVPDNTREGDETVEYILSSPDTSALAVGETRSLVITVSDQPDLTTVDLTFDTDITEGPDVTVVITATLDRVSPTGLTVSLTYNPTSSAEPEDYAPNSSLSIFIPAGELSSSLVLTITDDSFAELTEELRLDASTSNQRVGVNPATVVITIQDDVANDQTPILSFETSTLELKEGQRGRKLEAILTGGVLGEDLTINLKSTTGTAIEGTDYVLAEPTITIPAGRTTGAVEFIADEDGIYEFVEEVIYELTTPTTARVILGDTRSTEVTIVDLQEPPTVSLDTPASITEGSTGIVTVRLDSEYGFPLRLALLASRIIDSVSSYRILTPTLEIAPGDTMAEFEIEAIDDDLYEEDENFRLNLRVLGAKDLLAALEPAIETATMERKVTIVDDQPIPTVSLLAITDVSEGDVALITAELTGKLAVPVLLTLNTGAASSAVQFTDYLLSTPTLEIAAGDLTAQFEISALTDGTLDGIKTVELALTVSGSVVNVVDGLQTLTILDADALRPSLTLDTVAPIDEGDTRVVTARLLNGTLTTPLTITVVTTLASDPTSAADSLDYSLSATTIEIPANSLDVTFTITGTDDDVYEGEEQFILSLRPNGDKVDLGTVTRTVTIRDNDHLPSSAEPGA